MSEGPVDGDPRPSLWRVGSALSLVATLAAVAGWQWGRPLPLFAALSPGTAPSPRSLGARARGTATGDRTAAPGRPPPEDGTPRGAPRLPTGEFRPKQSLGQNFLVDPGTIFKIVDAFSAVADEAVPVDAVQDPSQPTTYAGVRGRRVLEIGPGIGALTDLLYTRYPAMQAVELDQRAIEQLTLRHPGLTVHRGNAVDTNYTAFATAAGAPLSVVGNLPYYITTDLIYGLLNGALQGSVHAAAITVQWEAAQRFVTSAGDDRYGVLPICLRLFAAPSVAFRIPRTVFYPSPRVDSALLLLRFHPPDRVARILDGAALPDLRRVLSAAFNQRRKMLRNSLRALGPDADLDRPLEAGVDLPQDWLDRRPEDLRPAQFVAIVHHLFGRRGTVIQGPLPDGRGQSFASDPHPWG